MLDEFRKVETAAAKDGLSFAEAMRLLAGAHAPGDSVAAPAPTGRRLSPGRGWRRPSPGFAIPPNLRKWIRRRPEGDVRPYQQVGVRWLHLLSRLGLGACLADDMGLGKTIQVLALLLILRRDGRRKRRGAGGPAARRC